MDKHTISNNYGREILKDGDVWNNNSDYESEMHRKHQAGQQHKNVVV